MRVLHFSGWNPRTPATARALALALALALSLAVGCGDDALIGAALPDVAGADAVPDGSTADGLADGSAPSDGVAGTDAAQASDAEAKTDVTAASDVPQVADAEPDGSAPDATEPDVAGSDVATGLCPPSQCELDGACVENNALNPANVCQKCLVVVDRMSWTAFDGGSDGNGSCDDGAPCTSSDRCEDGQCVGTAVVCDDANLCTNDSCCAGGDCVAGDIAAGDCVYLPNAATCDDGDACTVGDTCGLGACAGGAALPCTDGNLCTTDACDAQKGCQFSANQLSCDDGDACTQNDACSQGACSGGGAISCDDGDVCTVDSCDADSGCQHKSIANLCTDDNLCTDQTCDKDKGCIFPFNTEPCDDGNACTGTDTCTEGLCKGSMLPVDDNNLCTDDSCDPAVGVLHAPNNFACDDGNACTLEDVCFAAECLPGAKKPNCDDGNFCTDDACDLAVGCTHTDNILPCDDGSACTTGDVCLAGDCTATAVVCDDGNDCTADSCDKNTGCKSTLIVSNSCRPNIEVDYPPRAATIESGSSTVTVTGKVFSGAGPISFFQLNGNDVAVQPDGSFSFDVAATPGGNTLVFLAKDSMGSEKKRVQAYHWSTEYKKPDATVPDSGYVDPGVAFWLSKGTLDDGDHSLPPNDLATIFELFFANFDIQGLLPNPLTTQNAVVCTAEVAITSLTYDPAKVVLTPGMDDTLRIQATISKISGGIKATGVGGIKALCNSNGSILNTSNIKLDATLKLTVNPTTRKIDVAVASSDVAAKLDIGGFSGGLGFLINLLSGVIEGAITPGLEDQLNSALVNQVGPVLGDALGALALDTTFGFGKLDGSGEQIALRLQTDFADIDGTEDGIAFIQRGRVTTTKAVPYDNLGIPGRIGCAVKPQTLTVPKASPLELALRDDVLNQLLYGAWNGGLLEFPVPPSMLGSVDLSQYGVSDLDLKVSAMLAPVASDCNVEQSLDAHIGDLRVDAKLKLFGQPLDVVVYATLTAGVALNADSGAIGIALSDIKSSELQVDVLQENLVGSEAVLGQLIQDNLIGALLGTLTGTALGSFPLPSIDLSGAVAGLPPGTGIAINPQKVERIDGTSVIGGTLK